MNLDKQISVTTLQTIVFAVFGLLFLYFGLTSFYQRIVWCDGYALGDWLINYSDGGYKRRGLSGTVLLWISKFSGIYIGRVVFVFVSSLYLIYVTLIIYYFRKIQFDFYLVLYFLLPTVFFFPINDLYAFGRKEFLFFCTLLLFVIMYKKGIVYSWRFIFLFSTILFILTHIHESVVFYTPYILLIYFNDYITEKKGSLQKIFVLGLSTFIPALLIFLFGVNVNSGETWTILKSIGVGSNVMNGVFSYPIEGFGQDKLNALEFVQQQHYETHFISYILTLTVLTLFLIRNNIIFKPIYKYLIIHLILLFISIPIFYLTIDWGRWLNIHFICLIIVLSLKLPSNTSLKISYKEIIKRIISLKFTIQILFIALFTFYFTMKHVSTGFEFGQNNFLTSIRDLFWNLRN